jgi:hypothetical protein
MLNPYATDKLRELDVELARRPSSGSSSMPTPVLGPLARAIGRTLRRAGERLESWSSPAVPDGDGIWPVNAQGAAFNPKEDCC